jgi:hypothetical protein
MLPSRLDSRSIEERDKIREEGRKLHLQRVNLIIQRTQNPPYASLDLIATVHENLVLKQMKKYLGSQKTEGTDLFWKNQKRFLEFICLNNPYLGLKKAEKAKIGYKYSHAWFLDKNPEYTSKFRDMDFKKLQKYREENWKIYNNLCRDMHEISQKYNSLDEILVPVI